MLSSPPLHRPHATEVHLPATTRVRRPTTESPNRLAFEYDAAVTCFATRGNSAALGDTDGAVTLVELEGERSPLQRHPAAGGSGGAVSALLWDDGVSALVARADGGLQLYDAPDRGGEWQLVGDVVSASLSKESYDMSSDDKEASEEGAAPEAAVEGRAAAMMATKAASGVEEVELDHDPDAGGASVTIAWEPV